MNIAIKTKFSQWISECLKPELLENVKAFNFNLYEGEDNYHIQLIGSGTLPTDDDDWACDEVFTSGENVFLISRKLAGDEWEEGLAFIIELVKEYLVHGKQAGILKYANAVGVGFVDGDIEIVYQG